MIKIIGFIILVLFGVFMVVFGEFDDSPGAQMIGLVAIVTGIIFLIRKRIK